MRLDSPWWLLAALALPLAAWVGSRWGRDVALVYSSVALMKGITGLAQSRARKFLRGLRWVALALVAMALARPQSGAGRAPLKASGVDIAVALDLSGSMLAEDFEVGGSPANRIEVAKDVLRRFVENRPADRFGLVVFAGRAYIASPPTLDHSFLLRNMRRLEALNEQGTAIGAALSTAVNRLRDLPSKSRIVLLMTDGQNNAGNIPPLTAADAAAALGVKVYTIGIGTRGTARTPVATDGFGRKVYRQVPVDIDEDTLRQVAARTGGKYYRADSTETLRSIYAEIDEMEKTEMEARRYAAWEDWMAFLLVPALGLLVLETMLSHTVWRKLP